MQITDDLLIEKYYAALLRKDASFVGQFYACVKTTKIFCLPTCTARKPKFENVDYVTHLKDALAAGYRPCKRCKPTQSSYVMPEQVTSALQLLYQAPKHKIKDQELRSLDIDPVFLRRWFNQHYGMTFQAYQRMFRINNAYQELQAGKTVEEAAYTNGYESLSGFNYTRKKMIPAGTTIENTISMLRFNTELDPMFACATDKCLCLLEFVDRRMLEAEFADLQSRLKARIIIQEHPFINQVRQELQAYFKGDLQQFTVPLHTPGTEFQQEVWQALLNIPYGKVRSYLEQAQVLGNPKAVRAVARANGMNRIAIVIPCHRVVGSDGSLTGYAGGLERKRYLLDLESSQAIVHQGELDL